MDYAGMAQRLGQFRQAQVPGLTGQPGGGQRPLTRPGLMAGLDNFRGQAQGMMQQGLQGLPQRPQGMAGWFGGGNVPPQMGQMRPRNGGMGGGGSFGG
jgi:hypothetical protein